MFTYCKTPKISNVIPIMGFYLAAKATLVALKKNILQSYVPFYLQTALYKVKTGTADVLLVTM